MRILLLDDNPQDRFLAKRELKREFPDAEIVEIFDPASLGNKIIEGCYELVVTDCQMSWTDGTAILKAVKSRDPFLPVVMFTKDRFAVKVLARAKAASLRFICRRRDKQPRAEVTAALHPSAKVST